MSREIYVPCGVCGDEATTTDEYGDERCARHAHPDPDPLTEAVQSAEGDWYSVEDISQDDGSTSMPFQCDECGGHKWYRSTQAEADYMQCSTGDCYGQWEVFRKPANICEFPA
jgi:hypothetical protein